jgi:hypothetical protein
MGIISRFDLKDIRSRFGIDVAIETGTYRGGGTLHLSEFFDTVYTIEIIEEIFNSVTFSKGNIVKYLGDTATILPIIISEVSSKKCLFWLDAHLPYLDGVSFANNVYFPLEDELRIISNSRNFSNDYFIIDDLRIYEDGPFTSGPCPPEYRCSGGLNFIYDIFDNTHIINKDYTGEGYIIMSPKHFNNDFKKV